MASGNHFAPHGISAGKLEYFRGNWNDRRPILGNSSLIENPQAEVISTALSNTFKYNGIDKPIG